MKYFVVFLCGVGAGLLLGLAINLLCLDRELKVTCQEIMQPRPEKSNTDEWDITSEEWGPV